ncbi:hypothetical protein C9374_001103 [Naegleria lovaniensis]|uniref:Uncharacterized protein n=1 Tax=Naegleria lovaniensis TaxID=51637 RepID=A0AA88GWQ0_NAELO|nr:uncharacterized protein C9374_001103 [Naegleria lovaniensis]KAG2387509.1 hypothetical protein C9374_001103 [Naegleria lovaniensis]
MSSDSSSTPNLPNDFPSTRPPQTIVRKKVVMVRKATSAHSHSTVASSNSHETSSMTTDTPQNNDRSTNPLCHTQNNFASNINNSTSITDQQQMNEENENLYEQQQQKTKDLSLFTSTVIDNNIEITGNNNSSSESNNTHSNIIKRIIENKSKSPIIISVDSPTSVSSQNQIHTSPTTITSISPTVGSPNLINSSLSEVIPSAMRARSNGRTVTTQATEKDFDSTLNECEKLKSTRKFGDLERVCRDFLNRFFSSESKMAQIYVYLACALREGLLFRDALKCFDEALVLDSSLSEKSTFLRDYGHTLVCDEQYERANQYFEKSLQALEKESNSNDMADRGELKSAMFLCTILGDQTNLQDVNLQSYLSSLDTNHALTHYAIGLYYERKCDYQNAIQYYKSSQIKEPSFDCAYERVGMCHLKLGVLERAKSSLDLACTLNRQNFRALFELAKLHLRCGSTANCKIKLKCIIERASTLVESSSDRLRLYQYLAESYYLLAIIKYSSESEDSEKSETLFNEAIRYFQRYHELVQEFPNILANYSTENYYNTLGLCHMYADHVQEAGECFAKAIELEPSSPYGYYNLGVLFEMSELYDDALQSFSQALKLAPTDTDCVFAVKRVTRKKKNAIFTNYGLIGTEIINN